MPSPVRLFRLATAIVTLALVAFVMIIGADSPYRRVVAGGVLAFGVAQWLFLGLLGRQFAREDEMAAEKMETSEDSSN